MEMPITSAPAAGPTRHHQGLRRRARRRSPQPCSACRCKERAAPARIYEAYAYEIFTLYSLCSNLTNKAGRSYPHNQEQRDE